MALIDKLTSIADGFRQSRGTTDKYTLDQMAVLAAEPTGGGGNEPTDEELTITGDCNGRFSGGHWDWFITKYSNRITTTDISSLNASFSSSSLEEIPFQLNIKSAYNLSGTFSDNPYLRVCPIIRGTIAFHTSTDINPVAYCSNLRDIEELFTPDMLDEFSNTLATGQFSSPRAPKFQGMTSLRCIPSWWYKFKLCERSYDFPYASYTLYQNMLNNCYCLDEVQNIPVWKCTKPATEDMFYGCFKTGRLKSITFETNEDGSPIVAEWNNQNIDLSELTTWYAATIYSANSGITADKQVTDDATYQALKNDPDWFTVNSDYSRYNHDSAVETINSLPDTSAYLAANGGTNTIKFSGEAGSATDGGAINTLTEEEIAVATAKGWTVTFV